MTFLPVEEIKMAWTIGSSDIMPQLLTLQDPASQYIWQPNGGAAGPSPGALLGLPLMLSEKSGASLGTRGDLILTNLNYHALGIREGATVRLQIRHIEAIIFYHFVYLCGLQEIFYWITKLHGQRMRLLELCGYPELNFSVVLGWSKQLGADLGPLGLPAVFPC